jgi:hypothetical protein
MHVVLSEITLHEGLDFCYLHDQHVSRIVANIYILDVCIWYK